MFGAVPIFAICTITVTAAQFNPTILQDSRDLPKLDGTFGFLYRTEDGIAHAAKADPGGIVHGRFTYTDPTGLKVNYNYNAGSSVTPKYNYDAQPAPAYQPQYSQQQQPLQQQQQPLQQQQQQQQYQQARGSKPPSLARNYDYYDDNDQYSNNVYSNNNKY